MAGIRIAGQAGIERRGAVADKAYLDRIEFAATHL